MTRGRFKIFTLMLAFALCFMIASAAAPAMAQEPTDSPGWRVSLSGAYSLVRNQENEHGYVTSGTVRISPRFAVRGDYFNVNSPGSAKVILGGVEYRFNAGKIVPSTAQFSAERFEVFATALAGAVRHTDLEGTLRARFAYALGGGLDTRVDEKLNLRLFEIRYVRAPIFPGGELVVRNNAMQISTGAVLRF